MTLRYGEIHAGDRRCCGFVDIHIRVNDQWIFTAQLQAHILDTGRGHDRLAGLDAAGESDAPDIFMPRQRCAAIGAVAGDDIDYTRREMLLNQFAHE